MHRPNVPLSELPFQPDSSANRAVLALAAVSGLLILGVAFWPAIAEFFTPFKLAFVLGTVFGVISGCGILGLLIKPCGKEAA